MLAQIAASFYAVAEGAGSEPGVVLSTTWLPVIIPVSVAAATIVGRSLTAKERLRKKYEDDIWKARDGVQAAAVSLVSAVVVRVHPLVTWPRDGLPGLLRGQPGDPEMDVARRLVGRAFADDLNELAKLEADAGEVARVPERLLHLEHASGRAMAAFLTAWLYLAFWASSTGVALPHWVTWACGITAVGALGWFAAVRLLAVREVNQLSDLVKACKELRPMEEGS